MRKNIKFGMPTLIECNSLEDTIQLCKELNLDFIELNMNLPKYQRDAINPKQVQRYLEQNEIFFTIHLDENLRVCDFNEEVANAYLATVSYAIELAKELRMPVLNMHMDQGVYFTLPTERVYLFEKYHDIYQKKLIRFRELCEKQIGESRIKICIENSDGYSEFTKEAIQFLLQSKVFGLTYDIGHDHCIGNQDQQFIMERADRLVHMHFHDAAGKKDHLPLGAGEIDIVEKLNLAKKTHCTCVLETKTIDGLRKSVEYINRSI